MENYNSNSSNNPPEGPSYPEANLELTEVGQPLSVTHYGIGQFYDQENQTPGTIYATLPTNWDGYQVYNNLFEISDFADYLTNGDFSSGITGWTEAEYDQDDGIGGLTPNTVDEADSGEVGGQAYMMLSHQWENQTEELDHWNNHVAWHYYVRTELGDHVNISQTIASFPRGTVLSADLSFDFATFWGTINPPTVYSQNTDLGGVKLRVYVEGVRLYDNNIFLAPNPQTNNTQTSASFSIPGALFNTGDGIDVVFQLYQGTNVIWSSTDDAALNYKFGVFIDNIVLDIQAEVNPTTNSLQMDGNVVSPIGAYGTGDVGYSSTWSGSPSAPVNVPFSMTGSATTYFDADLDLYARSVQGTKYTYSQIANGTHFEVESGTDVNWDFYVFGLAPSGYYNYRFEITKPSDWTNITVLNPYEIDVTASCAISSTLINVTNAAYNDVPGWYKITATSHNYVDAVRPQILDGTWQNSQSFRVTNTTRIQADILDGTDTAPAGVTSTNAYLEIYFPNGTLWLSEYTAPAASGVVTFSQLTIPSTGANAVAGNYSVIVRWNDTTGLGAIEAGRLDSWFVVTHGASVIPRTGYDYIFGLVGDNLYPRIDYIDTEINATIREATIVGNWSGGPVTFTFLTSYYEAELDTSALSAGTYYMVVNASKFAYDSDQTIITVELGYETYLTSPQSPAVEVAWRNNVTIEVDYTRQFDGGGINNCVSYSEITANWSGSPGVDYSITFISNGRYEIELNTSEKAIGNYLLNITANKAGYTAQQLSLLVKVRARATSMSSPQFPLVSEYYNEYTSVFVTYRDEDAGIDITGTVISNWTGATVTSMGGGTYNVTFRTNLALGDYFLNVTATRANFQSAQILIKIRINERITDLTYDPPAAVPIESLINITVTLLDGVNGSALLNSTSQLYISVNASLSGYWTSYDMGAGVYNLEIDTSAPIFTTPANYYIDIDVTWTGVPYYSNESVLIRLTVRTIGTTLNYDPPGQIPYGNYLNLSVYYTVSDSESIYDGNGIGGATIGLSGYTPGVDYNVFAGASAGDYIIQIFSATLSSITTYSFTVTASGLSDYQATNRAIDVTVRKLQGAISAQAVGTVPYGNEVNISISITYDDPDSYVYDGQGIAGLTATEITISGGHSYIVSELSGGDYVVTLLNGTLLSITTFDVGIQFASAATYTGDYTNVSFTVRKLQTLLIADPVGSAPTGNEVNVTVHFTYNDPSSLFWDGIGVTGLVKGDFNMTVPHDFNLHELGNGDYVLEIINTTVITIQTYVITITIIDTATYNGDNVDVSFQVRKLSASLTISPIGSQPYGNNVNLTVNAVVNDPASLYWDGLGITGLVDANFTISGAHSFTIEEQATAGEYVFTISNSTLFTITSYPITIDMATSQTISAASADTTITIREISTSLTATPAGSKPVGNPVDISINVIYSDGNSQFYDGIGITGLTVANFQVSGGHSFTVSEVGNGDYTLTILNGTILTIQSYVITITLNAGANYTGDSVQTSFDIRSLATSIIAQPVGTHPYGNEVNVSLSVTFNDPESLFYDGDGIAGLTTPDFSITGGHVITVTAGAGAGDYTMIIANGTIITIQSYSPTVSINAGTNYTGSSTQVSFQIRQLTTSISATPPVPQPYGNEVNISITVEYSDPASQWYHGMGITGLTTGDFSISGGHSITVYEVGNGDYTVVIDNGTLLTVQAYSVQITLSAAVAYQSSNVNVDFNIRNLITQLNADLVPDQPYDEDVNVTVYYTVNDPTSIHYHTNGITGADVNITGWTYSTDYVTYDLGNGVYILALSKSRLTLLTQYSLSITASNVANRDSALTTSIFNVRAISTSFTYVAPSPTPWGYNITIDLTYKVEDSLSSQNTNPVTAPLSVTVNESDSFSGDWVEVGGGLYQVELDTAALSSGTYITNITIYKQNYVNRSVIVTFTIIPHRTQVTYDIVDPSPWGKNTTIVVYFMDLDNGSQQISSVYDITLNESQSLGYNWVDNGDYFTITLDTTDPEIWFVGSFKANVSIYQFDFQNSSTLIPIIKQTRSTDIFYETPDIVPFQQNATVKFRYQDLDNSTSAVGINNNTNPQIPGLINYAGNVSMTLQVFDSSWVEVGSVTHWFFTMENVVSYGDGWYNVTIDTNSLGLIGTYYARIFINWMSNILYYNQTITIPFNVRAVTALLEYQPPGSQAYTEGGYVPVWVKYTDIDNSLPIDGATINITYIEDPSNVQLTNFVLGTNYTVEPFGVGDNTRGQGWYLIKVTMGSSFLNVFGSYDFRIKANKTNYDTRELLNVTFAIRQGFTQFTSPFAPASFITDGLTNITISYYDSESGIGIVNQSVGNVILTWVWYNATHPNVTAVYGWSNTNNSWIASGDTGNYPMGDDGRYQILLDASGMTIGDKFIIGLNISAGVLVESQHLNISFIIEPQSSVMGVTQPLEVVYGETGSFNVTYQKTDGSGINGTSISLYDLDAGASVNPAYYQVVTIDNNTGLYQININTTFKAPAASGYHQIRVDATGAPYTPRSLNVYLRVRPIDSQVVITPSAAKGYNELTNITLTYRDVFYDRPINDSNLQDLDDVIIDVTNILSTHWSLYVGSDYGQYIIEINNSYWGSINEQGFSVSVDVLWSGTPYFQNWTGMSFSLPVRARSTDFSYPPPTQAPYGANSSITFTYRDIEAGAGAGISNVTGDIRFYIYDSYMQLWNSSGFAWVSDAGSGDYDVEINTSKLPTIGSYTFTSVIQWLGEPYYNNQTSIFNVTTRQLNTILSFTPSAPIPYGNHLDLDFLLNISDSYRNGEAISTAQLNITSISGIVQGSLTFSYGTDYIVTNQGAGRYTLRIFNTSLLVDTYTVALQASNYHVNLIYTNATANFGFEVRKLVTSVIITPISDVPYGNSVNISVLVKYTDFGSTYYNNRGITGLNDSTLVLAGAYTYQVIDLGSGNYIVQIANSSILTIQSYSVNLTLQSTSTHTSANALSSFNVRKLNIIVTADPVGSVPYGNEVNITVHVTYVDPDSLYYDGLGIAGISSSNFSISGGHSFNVHDQSGGDYIIEILNTTVLTITSYIVTITIAATPTYNGDDVDVAFDIRKIVVSIGASPLGEIPFGNEVNVSLLIRYSDSDSKYYNLQGVTGLVTANFSITGGHTFVLYETGSGNYILSINNNTVLTIQAYSDIITLLDSADFTGDSTDISFTIRKLVTSITADPIGTHPYGNEVNITVHATYADPTSLYYSGGITGLPANNFSVTGGHSFLLFELGSGDYVLEIQNSTILTIQSYGLTITLADTQDYTGSSSAVSFTIRLLQSLITVDPIAAQPYGNVINLTVHITINDGASLYWDGLGITGLTSGEISLTGGHTYTVHEQGGGDYVLEIENGTLLTIQSYPITISVAAGAIYVGDAADTTIVIRRLTVSFTASPVGTLPYGNPVNISVHAEVVDFDSQWYNGLGLTGLTTPDFTVSGGHSFVVIEIGNGDYVINIANGTILTIQPYNVLITLLQGSSYSSDDAQASFTIRELATALVAPPVGTHPYGNEVNVSLTVQYDDPESLYWDGVGITGLTTPDFSITGGHSISVTEGSGGAYTLTISNGTILTIQSYSPTISISGTTNYTGSNTQISFTIRKLTTLVTADPVGDQPYGNEVNITVHATYNDPASLYYHLNGITGLVTSNFTVTGGYTYLVSEIGSGDYIITIENDTILNIQGYATQISIPDTQFYTGNSFNVSFSIRQLTTSIIADPIGTHPYGNEVNITVHVRYSDPASQYYNGRGITGLPISNFSVTGGHSFTLTETATAGDYILTIQNGTILTIQTYIVSITVVDSVSYTGSSVQASFTIRELQSLLAIDPITAQPYGNVVNLTIHVTINDGASLYYDGSGITGLTSGEISLTGGHTYTVHDLGSGDYIIEIENGTLLSIQAYPITISLAAGVTYAGDSADTTIVIRRLSTSITASPVGSVPYGNPVNISVHIEYTDFDSQWYNGLGVTGLTDANFQVDGGHSFTSTEISGGDYVITIANGTILTIQSYIVTITLNQGATYLGDNTLTSFTIRQLATSIVAIPLGTQPYGNEVNVSLQVSYSDTESLYWDGVGITGLTTPDFSITGGHSITIFEGSSGSYTLVIGNGTILGIQSYSPTISIGATTNYTGSNVQISFSIRKLTTSLTNDPVGIIPYGNSANFTIHAIYLDPLSQFYDGDGITGLTNTNFTVSGGHSFNVFEIGGGDYYIVIDNLTLLNIQQYSITFTLIAQPTYVQDTTDALVTVRKLITIVTADPIGAIPYGNYANITIHVSYTDPASQYYDGDAITGLTNANFSLTGGHTSNIIEIGSGDYSLIIQNTSLLTVTAYSMTLTLQGITIYVSDDVGIAFSVRRLITSTVVYPVGSMPIGNYINLTVLVKYSDLDSMWYHDTGIVGLTQANFSLTGGHTISLVEEQGSGNYLIQINNNSFNSIQTYNFLVILASSASYSGSSTSTGIIIRELTTALTVEAVPDVPYGNEANFSLYFRVSDPFSLFWDGDGIPGLFSTDNFTTDGGQTFDVYDLTGGYYIISIHNTTLLTVGSYSIDVTATGGAALGVFWENASYTVNFNVRALHTALTYRAVPPWYLNTPFGDNVTLGLDYIVNDPASLYHDGAPIDNSGFEIGGMTNGTDYIYTGNLGNYTIEILSTAVPLIQTYYIDINAYYKGIAQYDNASLLSVPFTVRKVYTTHTVWIGNQSLPGFSGWPWGENVTIRIYYNSTDHPGQVVQNSNISVVGSDVYQNGNYTVTTYTNGTFIIYVDGSAGEHGVGYTFDVTLFTPADTHLNETFLVSLSFRKSVGQVFLKEYPVYIPWGDNITIMFSYNNTEAGGYPGIDDATVNVLLSNASANPFFTYYNVSATYGPGMWIITMNTTWAAVTPTTDIPITFIIQAESLNTIYSETFHTVFIQALEMNLVVRSQDYSVYLDEASSFNVTLALRDRSHYNKIFGNYHYVENNSYWVNGSQGQYDDIEFYVTSRGFEYTNMTWYYGSIDLYPAPSQGNYTLRFNFNESGYPPIQELLTYVIQVRTTGKYVRETLDSEITIFTINLILRTHNTALTFDWATANATASYPVANFSTPDFANAEFINDSQYIYGDVINITFFWWDLDAFPVEGISPGNIKINYKEQNGSDFYYRVFNLFELYDNDQSYKGLYTIQIDTRIPYKNMVKNWTITVNATLDTFDRIYKLVQGVVQFELLPINTLVMDKREPKYLQVPFGDDLELHFNVTDIDHNTPIPLSGGDINGTIAGATATQAYAFYMDAIGTYRMRFYSLGLDFGTHNATIIITKQNYVTTVVNFSFTIRPILTTIEMYPILGKVNYTDRYRQFQIIEFRYIDIEDSVSYDLELHTYHTPGRIVSTPTNPLLFFGVNTSWADVGGTYSLITDETINGVYKVNVSLSANVNRYQVEVFVNLTPFAIAYKTIWINVTKANTYVTINSPAEDPTSIYQLLEGELQITFLNEYNEPMTGTVYCLFRDTGTGGIKRNVTLTPQGNGVYTARILTSDLTPGGTYSLEVYAISGNSNYANAPMAEVGIIIKPIWEHPIFIITMIAVAVVAGAWGYRRVKWIMLPREIKAIEIAKKNIKKNKEVDLPFRDIKDRDWMFASMFSDAWNVIGIKPPKLVRPEVVLFASEVSAILRTRMTTPEAESMINTLKTMNVEEAERHLGEMKIPPEATRRLLTIAGLIEKERMEVINFSQILSEVKGMEISYSQAEEIMITLQSMSPFDADKYLEAMVIPAEERQKILDSIGVKTISAPKKVKAPKKEKPREKEKPKEEPMDAAQIRAELNKLSGLSDEEKDSLLKDMEKLTLKEQKDILKNLKG